MSRFKFRTNEERSEYCIGCAWLHVGDGVGHNHCDYTAYGYLEHNDDFQRRTNGHTESSNVTSFDGTCRYFWDKEIEPIPNRDGMYYKAPKSDKCPKIPTT